MAIETIRRIDMTGKCRKDKLVFIILALASRLVFFGYGGNGMMSDQALFLGDQTNFLIPDKLLFFIIEFESFACLSCLDSFLEFYHQLPSSLEQASLWGILIVDWSGQRAEQDHSFKIIEKKLRGFIKANQIQFPILIDRFQLFNGLGKEGISLILFDRKKRTIKKYVFPLRQIQKKEIVNNINEIEK